MIDVVLRAVAAPAGRQLHRADVERLPRKRGQGVCLALPGGERALQPLGIVAPRVILPVVRAAALGTNERAVGDAQRDLQHLLHAIGGDEFGIGAPSLLAQADVATLHDELLQLVDRRLQVLAPAEDADLGRHQVLHPRLDRRGVLRAAAVDERVEFRLFAPQEVVYQRRRDVDFVRDPVAVVGDVLADDHARDDRFRDRIAAQAVEAVHVPARRLAGREQALEVRALARVVGAHAAHRVVLRRPHRDPILGRIHAHEIVADLEDFAQVVPDVLLAQQRDIEPDVVAEPALRPLALGDVLLHASAHHVARRELLLLRLVVGHEAVAVDVLEQAAVAAAAFGDQNARRKDAGRMELDGLHVAERRDSGFQRKPAADALADDRVGRHPVDSPRAAGRDRRGLGDVGDELAGDEIAHDRAVAAAGVVDQRDRLGALVHRDLRTDRLVAHRLQHRVAGAVRDVARAPLLGAAEVALRNQAVGLGALGDRHRLAVDDDGAVALAHAAPRHAPRRELADRLGRRVDEHPDDLLVRAPVAAAHGVLEVDVLGVALPLDHVRERRLHSALGRRRVRTLGRHERQDDHVVAAALGADADAKPGEAAADHEDVGVYDLHFVTPCGAVCCAAGT